MTDTYDLTNPAKPTILKDPDDVLDYPIDWSDWLADIGDSIASAQVVIPVAGITLDLTAPHTLGHTVAGGQHIIWLSGGTIAQKYQVTSRIHTVGGRTADRSIWVKIKDR